MSNILHVIYAMLREVILMSTKHAILGLLNQRPMHGYEIKKEFEKSVSYIWSINVGQLYTLLKRMEEDTEIMKKEVPQENMRDRIVYEITDKGKNELQEWLSSPILRRQTKDEFYLKMMFLAQVDKEKARKFTDEQIKAMEQQDETFKAIKIDHGDRMDKFMCLLLEASIMHFEVDIKWLKLYKERMDL